MYNEKGKEMKTSSTKLILLSIVSSIILLGCGEGASSSSTPSKTVQNTVDTVQDVVNTISDSTGGEISVLPSVAYEDLFCMTDSAPDKTGIVVDAHGVQGLKIVCGTNENLTEQYGLFTCNTLPVSVYLGNFKLGELSKINKDKIVYTQDILNIARAATMHPDVTKVSMILQSLDEDAQLSNGIKITQESIDILDNDLANYTNISELTVEDVNNIIDDVIATRKTNDANSKLVKVTETEAQINLTEALSNTPAKVLDAMSYSSICE